jgi:hypothetical protein
MPYASPTRFAIVNRYHAALRDGFTLYHENRSWHHCPMLARGVVGYPSGEYPTIASLLCLASLCSRILLVG